MKPELLMLLCKADDVKVYPDDPEERSEMMIRELEELDMYDEMYPEPFTEEDVINWNEAADYYNEWDEGEED